jgi:transglutaminase-like putative cysteine protease
VSRNLERQRWFGALALAVAAPLPLTGIVSWPFLLPYLAAALVVALAQRPLSSAPAWLENLLAPLILVVVVAAGGMRYGVLRPVAQLAVLLAAVRLFGCWEARRSGSTLAVIGLVGTAGIASSTHPALAPYLLAVLALIVVGTGRLETRALLEEAGVRERPGWWPPWRLVAATVGIGVLVGAAVFVVLPRLRSPFAVSPYGSRPVSGFHEAIALHRFGEIKESRTPVLRLTFPGHEQANPEWLRLAGTTLQHYRGGLWAQGRKGAERLVTGAARTVTLGEPAPGAATVRVELELVKYSDVLFVPPGTVRLEPPEAVAVMRERLGTLRLPRGLPLPQRYAVEFDPDLVLQPPPDPEDLRLPAEPEAIRALAREATVGTGDQLAAALSLEQHLRDSYAYTTDLYPELPLRKDPVKWFLFEGKQGHCEFFAASMVLLLRSLDIPARMQAGYAGGERDPAGGFIVRDSHAHAWVLAWIDGRWRVFDPTPADGRPAVAPALRGLAFRLGWQRFEGWWDRWVLTFSLADQVEFTAWLARLVADHRDTIVLTGLLAALAVIAALIFVPRRRALGAAERRPADSRIGRELRAVMAQAAARGLGGGALLTPRRFAAALAAAAPEAAAPAAWLVRRHEACAYAGGRAPARTEVAAARRAVGRALRRLPVAPAA